jgi:hypothetical protein
MSTDSVPADKATVTVPMKRERRSRLAAGATIGTIHGAGTSFSKGQARRSRMMMSPPSRLSMAAPSSLRIGASVSRSELCTLGQDPNAGLLMHSKDSAWRRFLRSALVESRNAGEQAEVEREMGALDPWSVGMG